MEIINDVESLNRFIRAYENQSIGFVPTMGYLHEGHLSLVEAAKQENEIVIMSIFVNPLQFGPNEDLDEYPRDAMRDQALAKEAGVDAIFMPPVDVMYPGEMSVQMKVTKGANVLCGKSRPIHFDGVVTVLTKLFHLIQPTKAYFGLKDAQQFAVVHQLVEDFNFPLTVVGLPTIREADGLAKSSRNVYLSEEEGQDALTLYKGLQIGKQLIANGESHPKVIKEKIYQFIQTHSHGMIDYVDILSYPRLREIEKIDEQIIIAVAVQFAKARLIDNIIVTADGRQIERIN